VDLSDLKEILKILEEQDITEFELEQDGVKLRVCRGAAVVGQPAAALLTAAPAAAHPAVAAAPVAAAAGATDAPVAPDADGTLVRSPIVGTFYRSPDPNSPPFVSVGDAIKVGQVLCIIEAMKLMNEIEAEMVGEVTRIHPENGQPVQYGDPLFTIRPA
jgi:acetyl-CoA carboxylase biotin carboxyl carrier protein